MMYSRGGGRDSGSGGSNRGAPRGASGNRGRPNQPRKEPLRFDADYDFETANAQFHKEDIEKEFKKLNISMYRHSL